jgi:hypothetical protein
VAQLALIIQRGAVGELQVAQEFRPGIIDQVIDGNFGILEPVFQGKTIRVGGKSRGTIFKLD